MRTCICGSMEVSSYEHDYWRVQPDGSTSFMGMARSKFVKCSKCGLIRSISEPFTDDASYRAYYSKQYPPNGAEYKAKDYEHDRQVALSRCENFRLFAGADQRVLDVGCGSGALVDECRSRGMQAVGCDLAAYDYGSKQNIYYQRFEDIHFPTDHFNVVVCCDVLEHVPNPRGVLYEMLRVTQQGGTCIVEIPRYFHESGKHHWKDLEHLWYFNEGELQALLEETGFVVSDVWNPIESKVAFRCMKPDEERPTILVPPGMGDAYWTMVKLEAFIKREKLTLPDVTIVCNRERANQGHLRSVPYLQMFPFIHVTGRAIASAPHFYPIWKEAYAKPGRTTFRDILGYDYFVSYNGHLGFGEALETIDADLACNWTPPMFVSLEQMLYQQRCKEMHGRYVVLYFPFYSTYRHWTLEFPISEVIKGINEIVDRTGLCPVIVGERWDAADVHADLFVKNIRNSVNLMGQTTVAQLFGLLKGAELVLGHPSGLTVMAAAFGKKTVMNWNNYYNHNFWWHAVPPATRATTYFIEHTKGLTADKYSKDVIELMETGTIKGQKYTTVKSRDAGWQNYVPRDQDERPQGSVVDVIHRMPKTRRSVTVMCLYKSGGDYDAEYVRRLRNMVCRHVTIPFDFVCLTDDPVKDVTCIALSNGHGGWWSKVELFRSNIVASDYIVYFDLDTIILDNIDKLLKVDASFAALLPWNTANRANGLLASGIMAWDNDGTYRFIYDEFRPELSSNYPHGDQEYITKVLNKHRYSFEPLQELIGGIYSYKRNCIAKLPRGAKIVCFHGRPRPHTITNVGWVKDNWR